MKIKLRRLLCCFPTYGHCADASSQEAPPLLANAEYDHAEVSSRRRRPEVYYQRRRKSSVGGFQSAWRPSLCTIKENDVISTVVVGKGDMTPGSKRISYTPSDRGLNRPFSQHMATLLPPGGEGTCSSTGTYELRSTPRRIMEHKYQRLNSLCL